MIKLSNIFACIIIVTILLFSNTVYSESNVKLTMDDLNIEKDSEKYCKLNLTNVENLGSFSINISWNPKLINTSRITSRIFQVNSFVDYKLGYANITGFSIEEVSGSFTLLEVLIKSVGDGEESSKINITFCELLTAEAKPEKINCTYSSIIANINIKELEIGSFDKSENKDISSLLIIILLVVVFIFIVIIYFIRKQ